MLLELTKGCPNSLGRPGQASGREGAPRPAPVEHVVLPRLEGLDIRISEGRLRGALALCTATEPIMARAEAQVLWIASYQYFHL